METITSEQRSNIETQTVQPDWVGGVNFSELVGDCKEKPVTLKSGRNALVTLDDNTFSIETEDGTNCHFVINVNPTTERAIVAVKTRFLDPDTQQLVYHHDLYATQLFDRAMQHFAERNTNIYMITGYWSRECEGVENTNFQTYNNSRNTGLSPDESAKLTWTGQRLADWKYTRVKVVEFHDLNNQLLSVRAFFTKPPEGQDVD